MRALLRADWLRFRRRKDFWIIAIAVCVIGGVSFLASYRSEVQDPPPFNEAEYRQMTIDSGFLEGLPPEEATADLDALIADAKANDAQNEIEREAQQAVQLQKYDVVQSPFTVIGSGIAPLIALILIATLAIGDEFRFGTVRTSLLAAGSRRRFLAARLTSLFVITAGLFAALALLGIMLGIGLRLVGAEVSATVAPIDPGAGLAWLGAQILATFVVILLGTALTVLLRSGALPLVLIIFAGLIELFISALPIFAPGEFLSGVPQAFLTNSIRAVTARLGLDTHAIALAGAETPYSAIGLPLIAVAGIVLAWGLIFLLVADRRFRTMDLVE
jgi:ABC-type transport system involved in multi-copper enzyme maturation permease subunit